MIHVCSLARLQETVDATGASHVITLLRDQHLLPRPTGIATERHLILGLDDISDPIEGYICPADEHVADLIRFVQKWEREAPLVVHCYAGISRSTAAAFVSACTLNPRRDETAIARCLRAASPTATPNRRLVSIADRLLGRDGRMISAIECIGTGMSAYEGTPFRLELE